MTEAVFLALIALFGMVVFGVIALVLLNTVLKTNPTRIQFWTKYGWLKIDYDSRADK